MAKYFLIGSYVNAEYLNYSLDVAENELHINDQSTSDSGIQRVEITESDGIVEIAIRTVEKQENSVSIISLTSLAYCCQICYS